VADLFAPVTHSDGDNYTAADVNRLELGLDAVDTELDSQTGRIDALYAAGGSGGSTSQVPSGDAVARAATTPAIGRLFFDTSLGPGSPPTGALLVGTGSTWVNADGSAVTAPGGGGGLPGTTAAPQNLTATVVAGGSIGQINLSWDAVPNASFYTLYEAQSPNGVSGATALTTTSTSRTPSTARNYDYWVTDTVSGVASAASNHVTPTLPFTGGGGTTTGTDPSTFLNINGLGNGTGGWWNEGIGFDTGHVDITPTQLQGGYVNSPYYCMNSTGTAVQFQVFMNGGTTSAGTQYPRSELREYATGSTSTKAAWNGTSGTHVLSGATRVMHYAPIKCETVVAQIHDAAQDALQIRAEASSATGAQTWRLSIFGTKVKDLITGVALGTEVAWEIRVVNGSLTVKINGVVQYGPTSPGFASSGCYFKAGCYSQANSTDQANSSSEYHRIELRNLVCSHS
jgi:hypothetical protein